MSSQKPKCIFLAANKIIQQLTQKNKKILKNSCVEQWVTPCSPGISVVAGPENTDQQGGTVRSHQRLSKKLLPFLPPKQKLRIRNVQWKRHGKYPHSNDQNSWGHLPSMCKTLGLTSSNIRKQIIKATVKICILSTVCSKLYSLIIFKSSQFPKLS